MSKVTPFLMFNDQLEAAIEFYTTTFPDSEIRNVARTGNFQASLYGRLPFARYFCVLLDRIGCSFISGLFAGRTCWPRWNPLTHASFVGRAVSPNGSSGLVSPGLSCLPSYSITLRNLSIYPSFLAKQVFACVLTSYATLALT